MTQKTDEQVKEIIARLVDRIVYEKCVLAKFRERWTELGVRHSEFRIDIYEESIEIIKEVINDR